MKTLVLFLGIVFSISATALEAQLSFAQCDRYLLSNEMVLSDQNKKEIRSFCRSNYRNPTAVQQCEQFTGKGLISDLRIQASKQCQLIVQAQAEQ